LAAIWRYPAYMIIDEVSMYSKEFLVLISRSITAVRLSTNRNAPADMSFGGLNTLPLYCPGPPFRDTKDERLCWKIYEEFMSIVVLQEQCQVKDDRWLAFLCQSRYGLCTNEDIQLLRGLILGGKDCPETNFEETPWNGAVLITLHHCIRNQWNEALIQQHCQKTKQTLLISKAYNTVGDHEVTNAERYTILTQKGGKGKNRGEKGGLPHRVALAIGMKVMVILNVHRDLDIANGARGEIVGI
ncbi:hypothetical protein CALCODRAFT_406330, partial [Calocera cornea HHB12733]